MDSTSISTRALLALAIPSAASAILNNAYRIVDLYAVQWLGVAAQAALGSSTFILIALYAVFLLISAGAGPLIARATGAGDLLKREQILGNALTGAVAVGALTSGILYLGGDAIAAIVGLEGDAAAMMGVYLEALAVGGIPLAIAPLVDACFFAMGNATLPLILQVLFTLTNAALNWLLIYYLGMGISGAAFASVISRALTTGVGLWLLWGKIRWGRATLWPTETLTRIARVGLPIALNVIAYAFVYWALLAVAISPLGPEVNAALGVGFSALEGVSWPIFHGFELAVASMVGRQLGAGRPDLADRAITLAIPWILGAGFVAAVIFYFAAEPMCDLFTEDPAVLQAAILYAQVLAFSQVFVAIEALGEGVLAGAGDTRAVFWWSVPMNVLRVPLGWLLAFPLGMGAAGVWWAINLTTYGKALGKASAVIRGRWRALRLE
ncbi:MAG: MATE family efflux transporter [Myxococcota bacterium]